MEEEGRPAAPQLCQQPAKALRRTKVDLALRGNPLVAAPPARIRVAARDIKHDIAHRWRLDSGWRCLGGIRRLRHDGRSIPNHGDKQSKCDWKQAKSRHCGGFVAAGRPSDTTAAAQ